MFVNLLITLTPGICSSGAALTHLPPVQPWPLVVQDGAAERVRAAGKDVKALEALAQELASAGDEAGAAQAWEAIVRVDGNHSKAREALAHHSYDGQWFETYAELSAHMRKEAKRMLETKGLVRFGEEWVPQRDLPFRRMGWEAQEGGGWAPPGTAEQLAEDKELASAGWEKQDHVWIAPADFDKWRGGLWKVGDEWLDEEKANAARSKIGDWWQVPGEHFVGLTTVDRKSGQWVTWWADQVTVDLERLTGLKATGKPEFVVLNGIAQFNAFAAGDATTAPAEASGFSSLHYAFFADNWIEQKANGALFRGTGVGYWDTQDANLSAYGQHAVRHAAALAWLSHVDPSWNTVSLMMTQPTGAFPDAAFWGEKAIPRWMHYGAASYCERFFEDRQVGEDGDPLWSRKWALSNLAAAGEMHPVEETLRMPLSLQDIAGSTRHIHEAGLLVHYLLDGSDKKVTQAHQAWRAALVAGEDSSPALSKLEAALVKAESKIRALAGL